MVVHQPSVSLRHCGINDLLVWKAVKLLPIATESHVGPKLGFRAGAVQASVWLDNAPPRSCPSHPVPPILDWLRSTVSCPNVKLRHMRCFHCVGRSGCAQYLSCVQASTKPAAPLSHARQLPSRTAAGFHIVPASTRAPQPGGTLAWAATSVLAFGRHPLVTLTHHIRAFTSAGAGRESRNTAAIPAAAERGNISSSSSGGPMEVVRVPCLSDNYVWLLHEPSSGRTAVVDPAEFAPVVSELERRGWALDYVLNTHHHGDHVGANLDLKRRFPDITIVGPRADKDRIPGIDVQVGDGDTWQLGPLQFRVFDTPGHTRGHITYWVPEASALFPGDTLFALGCGRLFEGSPRQMWSSLSKLLPLPDDTRVYCAHEYTASNARFAVTVDPDNPRLAERKARVDAARARGEATVPSLLGEEKATNPFLRPGDPAIRRQVGLGPGAEDWEVFGAVRAAKDCF